MRALQLFEKAGFSEETNLQVYHCHSWMCIGFGNWGFSYKITILTSSKNLIQSFNFILHVSCTDMAMGSKTGISKHFQTVV